MSKYFEIIFTFVIFTVNAAAGRVPPPLNCAMLEVPIGRP
jgi:hypothetical protein